MTVKKLKKYSIVHASFHSVGGQCLADEWMAVDG